MTLIISIIYQLYVLRHIFNIFLIFKLILVIIICRSIKCNKKLQQILLNVQSFLFVISILMVQQSCICKLYFL